MFDYQKLLNDAEAMQDQLTAWRRYLHQHPELKMDTPVTERFICDTLAAIGSHSLLFRTSFLQDKPIRYHT